MLAIAFTSFKEALKKKLILLIIVMTVVYLAALTIMMHFIAESIREGTADTYAMFTFGVQFVSVLGLYFSTMLVAFLTIMASAGAVSSEIESGVIHGIITKPLRRFEYILGKYLGLAGLLLVYSIVLYCAVIMLPGMVGVSAVKGMGTVPLIKGMLYFILGPLVILALSFFGSVRFKTVNNGIFVIAIYILGLAGGMMEQIGAVLGSEGVAKCGIISSLISPFDTIYRHMEAAIFSSVGFTNPFFGGQNLLPNTVPSNAMTVYTIFYAAVLIFAAIRRFNRKDL